MPRALRDGQIHWQSYKTNVARNVKTTFQGPESDLLYGSLPHTKWQYGEYLECADRSRKSGCLTGNTATRRDKFMASYKAFCEDVARPLAQPPPPHLVPSLRFLTLAPHVTT